MDGRDGEEEEGVWETYMKISKRLPLQEVQLQHTYANIRQAVQSMFVSCSSGLYGIFPQILRKRLNFLGTVAF